MTFWTHPRAGQDAAGLRHHSDQGSPVRRCAIHPAVGRGRRSRLGRSRRDWRDNVLAEALNSLFTAEPIRNKDPFTSIEDLQIAVAEYIDWFNHRRVRGEMGLVPPVEHEEIYHRGKPRGGR
nr:IS3 family transposase [Micrococcus luteus]